MRRGGRYAVRGRRETRRKRSDKRSWRPAEGDEVLARERPQGAFTRQVMLGENLDADRLEAH